MESEKDINEEIKRNYFIAFEEALQQGHHDAAEEIIKDAKDSGFKVSDWEADLARARSADDEPPFK